MGHEIEELLDQTDKIEDLAELPAEVWDILWAAAGVPAGLEQP
ncbi:MAG: hypothetical protein ACRDQ4_27225 [Pseudonocardiaceae bacterium]